MLSGIKMFTDGPGPDNSREIIFDDKRAMESWCRDYGIPLDWIQTKVGQQTFFLRLYGKYKGVKMRHSAI
jgi:hypothetical protein